jgi:hypothetical protein
MYDKNKEFHTIKTLISTVYGQIFVLSRQPYHRKKTFDLKKTENGCKMARREPLAFLTCSWALTPGKESLPPILMH